MHPMITFSKSIISPQAPTSSLPILPLYNQNPTILSNSTLSFGSKTINVFTSDHLHLISLPTEILVKIFTFSESANLVFTSSIFYIISLNQQTRAKWLMYKYRDYNDAIPQSFYWKFSCKSCECMGASSEKMSSLFQFNKNKKRDKLPFKLCPVEEEHLKFIILLKEMGASIRSRNDFGLRFAVKKGHWRLVDYFLQQGSNVNTLGRKKSIGFKKWKLKDEIQNAPSVNHDQEVYLNDGKLNEREIMTNSIISTMTVMNLGNQLRTINDTVSSHVINMAETIELTNQSSSPRVLPSSTIINNERNVNSSSTLTNIERNLISSESNDVSIPNRISSLTLQNNFIPPMLDNDAPSVGDSIAIAKNSEVLLTTGIQTKSHDLIKILIRHDVIRKARSVSQKAYEMAISKGDLISAHLLHKAGATLSMPFIRKYLFRRSIFQHTYKIEFLRLIVMSAPEEIFTENTRIGTELWVSSCRSGDIVSVQGCLRRGWSVNIPESKGINIAVQNGYISLTEFLLESGARTQQILGYPGLISLIIISCYELFGLIVFCITLWGASIDTFGGEGLRFSDYSSEWMLVIFSGLIVIMLHWLAPIEKSWICWFKVYQFQRRLFHQR